MNNFFDKVYCINLDNRPDRWLDCVKEFEKIDLNVERISAINGSILKNNTNISNGALGLTLTVKNIIKDAINNSFNKILILEDDVVFTDDINTFNTDINYIPNDWEMVYFGGNHNTHMGFSPPTQINDYFKRLKHTYAAHAVGFNKNGINKVNTLLNGVLKEIDVMYTDIQKNNNVYCFNKLLATQRAGYSNIENRIVNYENLIK